MIRLLYLAGILMLGIGLARAQTRPQEIREMTEDRHPKTKTQSTSARWRTTTTTTVQHEWDESNAKEAYKQAVDCGKIPFLSGNLGSKRTVVKLERRDSIGWATIKESRWPVGP
jgi:hypothetical protein